MNYNKREETLEYVVNEAHERITTLGEELQESFDNTPESLQNSDANQEKAEAADAFSNVDLPDIPEKLKPTKINWNEPIHKNPTRAQRRDDAVEMLNACINELHDDKYGDDPADLILEIEQLIAEAESYEPAGR